MLSVNIKKRLGDFQLDVQFETDQTTLALLGHSGCGKSMTLKCIAGILTPDEGSIVLNGRTLFDSSKRINLTPQKRKVGYLFQEYALFPNMTVEQNIACALHSLPYANRKEAVAKAISRYQLTGLEKLKPYQLSGGQKQRTALARIMTSEPEVLLLDEPFSALDNYLKFQMELDLLDTLSAYDGDVVFVSHSRNEVSTICKDVCILHDGHCEAKERVTDMMSNPRTVSAALLSRCANFTAVKAIGDHLLYSDEWDLGFVTNAEIDEHTESIGIRAGSVKPCISDGIRPHSEKEEAGSNIFRCRIVRIVEDAKGDILLLMPEHAKAGARTLRMDTDSNEYSTNARIGDMITVKIAPEHIMPLQGIL